jgi:hypothetical protein
MAQDLSHGTRNSGRKIGADPEPALRKRLTDLFNSQRLAVLSTQCEGQPYSSLVAFAATFDLRGLAFATSRFTRKFENLAADPRAALLIDNRSNQIADFSDALAVTAVGRVVEVANDLRPDLLDRYLGKHPQLKGFAAEAATAFLQLEVETYILVEQFAKVQPWNPRG